MFTSLSSPSSLLFPFHWPFIKWFSTPIDYLEASTPESSGVLTSSGTLWFLSSSSLSFSSPYIIDNWVLPYGCVSSFPTTSILLSLYPYRYLPCQECYLLSLSHSLPPLTTSLLLIPLPRTLPPLLPWLTFFCFSSLISLPHSLFFLYSYPWMMSA